MAKKQVQFENFNDGVCALWKLDKTKKPTLLLGNVRFQERTVGIKRNFEAEQAGHTVQKLIRIPRMDFIKPGVFVVIEDQQYTVLQAQKILDTIPECMDLTLENPTIMLNFDESEVGAGGRI